MELSFEEEFTLKDCFKLEIFYSLALPRKKKKKKTRRANITSCVSTDFILVLLILFCVIFRQKREPIKINSSLVVFPIRERIQKGVVLELSLTTLNFIK